MATKDDSVGKHLMGCVAVMVSFPINWVRRAIEAWCVSIIWTWFAVPLGAPMLGVLPAFGLLAIVSIAGHGELADAKALMAANEKFAESTGTSEGVAVLVTSFLRLLSGPMALGACWVARALFGGG